MTTSKLTYSIIYLVERIFLILGHDLWTEGQSYLIVLLVNILILTSGHSLYKEHIKKVMPAIQRSWNTDYLKIYWHKFATFKTCLAVLYSIVWIWGITGKVLYSIVWIWGITGNILKHLNLLYFFVNNQLVWMKCWKILNFMTFH